VVAGAVVTLGLVFGATYLMLLPAIALVGWARVAVGDHTPTQVGAGAVLGGTVAAVVFSALR
jgi:membrane-associated phospholipid phosphatase